jgi:hypothetical protein
MEYMGSAEFEFGALPSSLKEMTKMVDFLDVYMVKPEIKDFQGKRMFLICTDEQVNYQEFFPRLIENKIRLKEYTELDKAISGKRWNNEPLNPKCYVNAWWDIDNHIMFCFGKSEAKKIIDAIKVVRDKKKAEGRKDWL